LMLIYVAAGVLLILSVDKFFISGLRGQINSLGQQIRLAEVRLNNDLMVQKAKDKVFTEYAYCQPFLKFAQTDEQQIRSELLREIENLTNASGGSVTNLSPLEATKTVQGYRKHSAEFQMEVDFTQLLNFLYKIQESNLLIKFDKLSIRAKDEQVSVLRVDGLVSIAVPL